MGVVDGEVVFSRRVSFRGFPSAVTIYSTVWGSGCFIDVGDSVLPGIDDFDLEAFITRYMPRVRDAVVRSVSRGLGFDDAVINALRIEVNAYLRSIGVDASSDDTNRWASLLFRGLYNYGVLEPVMLIGDEVGLTDIYMTPGARVHFKLSSLGDCQSNIVPSNREIELLISIIGDRVGVYPTYYNPSIETYDRVHRPMLRISIDSFDVTDRTRVSIRVFPTRAWKLIDMVRLGSIDARLAAYLWLALEVGVPVLVIGPAGSGKTSMSAALMSALSPSTVIAKVEDIDEVLLPQELVGDYAGGVIPLLSREGHGAGVRSIPLFQRLVHALRVGADYIFVNEVRSAEDTVAWLHAIMSGQVGGATTMHAEGINEALVRLRSYGAPIESIKLVVILMGRFEVGGGVVRRVVNAWVVDGGKPVIAWDGALHEDVFIRFLGGRFGEDFVVREIGDRESFLRHYSGFDIDEAEWVRLVALFHRARDLVMPREVKSDVVFDES
ncbi:type II secretion system protein E [Vulcanisaeta moutnovskia 768-28]|uniref:Type II secretion system protein E n=1 Tax=Vulcanisaeta moutnovskia (strain 768-28) TaxID=985053 RepID=F0QTJ5_VULM7|nr:type II secretion system protein E [Vulcanisaeta moutnovskia 768-28]